MDHPLVVLRDSLFFGNIQGICMARLRVAVGMVLGKYLPAPETPEGRLAAHPGVIWLAHNVGDNFHAIKRECRKYGVRLNDISGEPLP